MSRAFSDLDDLNDHLSAEDILASVVLVRWDSGGKTAEHVYEAIVRPPRLLNSYTHFYNTFPIKCAGSKFSIRGTYFCQQNGVSGVCAHATLRMLLNTFFGCSERKVTDPDINSILGYETAPELQEVQNGLTTADIGQVLQACDRNYQATVVGGGGVDYVSFLLSLLVGLMTIFG